MKTLKCGHREYASVVEIILLRFGSDKNEYC